jgi:hypothetical protein
MLFHHRAIGRLLLMPGVLLGVETQGRQSADADQKY